jgi:Fe-S-cluster containining protein
LSFAYQKLLWDGVQVDGIAETSKSGAIWAAADSFLAWIAFAGGAPAVHGLRYASGMVMRRLPARDSTLIQIVDAALADAARRSGEWLVCRPGCTQCCVGVFAINQLDAVRLQRGLAELGKSDPPRAERIRARARDSVRRLAASFPGDAQTGVLDEDPEAEERFADFGNDEACPVLDPETGRCELYDARPMTCRTFGPPVRADGGLGVCELCFHGASDEEIAECEMVADPEDLEADLVRAVEKTRGVQGQTVVAYCVR